MLANLQMKGKNENDQTKLFAGVSEFPNDLGDDCFADYAGNCSAGAG